MSLFNKDARENQIGASLADIVTIKPNGTDDTSAIQSVLDSGKAVRLQAGTYIVTGLTLSDNAKIVSSGYKTTLQQKTGTATGTRIIKIIGDNVFVDEITYIGNIATDTDEQNHAVFINKGVSHGATNVEVKGIRASNIRGDALYIGGGTFQPQNIRVGNIYATNCYRNTISITGGNNITIGDVIGLQIGMTGVDLESDTQGGHIKGVKIGNVITSNIGVVGAGTGYDYCENVEFGYVECRKSRMGSTPTYPVMDTDNDGVYFRNARNIKFKGLDIDGFDRFAVNTINSTGDRYNDNIEIETMSVSNCSLNETNYACYIWLGGVNVMKIKNMTSTTQTGKKCFKGGSYTANEQNVILENAKHTGDIFAYYCGIYGKNLNINVGTTTAISYVKQLSKIQNSTISGATIIANTSNVIFEGCNLTYSSTKENNGTNIYRNNLINGTYTA